MRRGAIRNPLLGSILSFTQSHGEWYDSKNSALSVQKTDKSAIKHTTSGEIPHCLTPDFAKVGNDKPSKGAGCKADSPLSPHSPLKNRGGWWTLRSKCRGMWLPLKASRKTRSNELFNICNHGQIISSHLFGISKDLVQCFAKLSFNL